MLRNGRPHESADVSEVDAVVSQEPFSGGSRTWCGQKAQLPEIALKGAHGGSEMGVVLRILRRAGAECFTRDVAQGPAPATSEGSIKAAGRSEMPTDQAAVVAVLREPRGEAIENGADERKGREPTVDTREKVFKHRSLLQRGALINDVLLD